MVGETFKKSQYLDINYIMVDASYRYKTFLTFCQRNISL